MLPGFVTKRDHDSDRPGFLNSQVARHDVRAEIMFAGECLYPFTGFLAYQSGIGERTGNRSGGNTGQLCKVADISNFDLLGHDISPISNVMASSLGAA